MPGPLTTGILDQNGHQGLHGESLVRSLVAAAGLEIAGPVPAYGKDVYIGFPGPRQTLKSPRVMVSIKSWSTPEETADGDWDYRLKVSNYNFLASENDMRTYLFLAVVPGDTALFSDATHDALLLRSAVYWHSFEGVAPLSGYSDSSRAPIVVPRQNLLTATTLCALVEGRDHEAIVAT